MPGNEIVQSMETKSPRTQSVKPRKLSVPPEPEDENEISHANEGFESQRERKVNASDSERNVDDAASRQNDLGRKPVVEIGPPRSPNGALSKGAVKDALQDWKVERAGPSGYRASRTFSRDRLVDQGSRVTAKRGSAKEVEGMFALAEAKNWDRMVFDGSDKFKERVMRTALEKGYDVKVNSKYDQKLFDKVRQTIDADRGNAMKGNLEGVELPKLSLSEPKRSPLGKSEQANGARAQTLVNGESNERSNPALQLPKNVTPAREMLEEAQLNVSHDNEVALTGKAKANENSAVLKKTLTTSI
jgi:hypothetical protein